MSETITKLRPDRDLQCYFQRPSAVAALSGTSPTGFTVSGSWRQQFDWAVVEWNRDNVFEHPQLRNLPDGDLSGIVLSYEEERSNCIEADSTLYPTVDWPSLRIWADPGTGEQVYKIPLMAHSRSVGGSVVPASATFTLCGSVTQDDIVELAWDEEHYNYAMAASDTLEHAAASLAADISAISSTVSASASGTSITLTVRPTATAYSGANGNRLGAIGTVRGGTEFWSPVAQSFSGGLSPSKWAFSITFSELVDDKNAVIPTNNIRKMRWTYAAALQKEEFQRCEFSVIVSNWSVTGTGLTYSVAGPGSRRIEDTSSSLVYSDGWDSSGGNFSGGTIHCTTQKFATCSYSFVGERIFEVFIGTRRGPNCASVKISIDGISLPDFELNLSLEDVLIRLPVKTIQPGPHILVIQHAGDEGTYLYLDFIELAVRSVELPEFSKSPKTTLATDWDTDHSIALSPERTAWLINKLGFTGRANHYIGALWFYELFRNGHSYATARIQFGGHAEANWITTLSIGLAGSAYPADTLAHLHLSGDTIETIAKAFELRINSGYTSVWASAVGGTLTIQSRFMGSEGNNFTVGIDTNCPMMTAVTSSPQLAGGFDGKAEGVSDSPASAVSPEYKAANRGWRTDLTATPRVNRAARDWARSFFIALKSYGIDAATAFSMELQHGDPARATGIAQRYPSDNPAILTTPALQTNFSPASLAFWQQAYAEMAQVMVDAGQVPYLQFGEVQWWYFPEVRPFPYETSGMPFYDDYTSSQFTAKYRRQMHKIIDNTVEPIDYPEEAEFLPTLIGDFTRSIQQFVRQGQPSTRFEVLYPCDTNDYPFTRVANLPRGDWTSATLDCLKTENFTFTGNFNLKLATGAIDFPMGLGFPPDKASHLVGISGPATPWQREADTATNAGLESVVLFALDQYCLIGYHGQSWRRGARSFMIP